MRCFLAVQIPEDVRLRAVGLQKELPAGLRLVEPQNLHLTCKFLGDVSERKVEEIKSSLKLKSPFDLVLKGVGVFPDEKYVRVVWVGAEEPKKYVELQKLIDEQLALLGFPKERDYTPHLTLARAKQRCEGVSAFLEKHRGDVFGTVPVRKVDLMESRLGPGGPAYSRIGEFALG